MVQSLSLANGGLVEGGKGIALANIERERVREGYRNCLLKFSLKKI